MAFNNSEYISDRATAPRKVLKFKRLHPDAVIPSYQNPGDSGMDICSLTEAKVKPGQIKILSTGLATEIPEGYELQVRPRSGHAVEGLTLVNAPATLDSGFRGEIKLIVINLLSDPSSMFYTVDKSISIKKGERVAQLVLAKVPKLPIVEVEELSPSQRGTSGFGSTGK